MILKFYNIEKNSLYQRHKFWMQINIFDIFDVFMIFFFSLVSFEPSIKNIRI